MSIYTTGTLKDACVVSSSDPKPTKTPEINFGVHSVHSENTFNLLLINEGFFGCDYLIQPTVSSEFSVYPKRGYVDAKSTLPLKIYFKPSAEMNFTIGVKILWEGSPLKINVVAAGGLGKLSAEFIEPRDEAFEGLDYGDIPYNSTVEKRWFLVNLGKVPMSVNVLVQNDEYQISRLGEPATWDAISSKKDNPLKNLTAWNWFSSMSIVIPPQMYVGMATKFSTSVSSVSNGEITIRSLGKDEFSISMRGKGGSVSLGVSGDLALNDIASNFTYTRVLKLINSGSISVPVDLVWRIAGQSDKNLSPAVRIVESYSALDPRGGWTRDQVISARREADDSTVFNAHEHWKMIQKLVVNPKHNLKNIILTLGSKTKFGWDEVLAIVLAKIRGIENPMDSQLSIAESSNFIAESTSVMSSSSFLRRGSNLGTNESLHMVRRASSAVGKGRRESIRSANLLGSRNNVQGSGEAPARKGMASATSAHAAFFKRRQLFFHLISNSVVSSQASSTVKPFISVSPAATIIPRFGEVEVSVKVNLSTEDTFSSTLLVRPQIASIPIYEVPLMATPKAVGILCDDTRIIDFHKQPIGESEVIIREFTNIGRKNIHFSFTNDNSSLNISPSEGILLCTETIKIRFTFSAVNEEVQSSDVIFTPDCSQHIRFKFYGGGGSVKCSLSKYRRFDFGQCMMNKETVSFLPITNQGSAVLNLTRFELDDNDVFYKGNQWPTQKISLYQGDVYNLPIIFIPKEENPIR